MDSALAVGAQGDGAGISCPAGRELVWISGAAGGGIVESATL